MKPTIGRIVHYVAEKGICAAVITAVWSNTCVNLRLFPDDVHAGGDDEWKTSCTLGTGEVNTWNWPPIVSDKKKEEVKPNV